MSKVTVVAGIGVPTLQSLATRQVPGDLQGQFQGVLASAVSLASIIAPLFFSSVYFVFQKEWPGAIWLSVIVLYAVGAAMVLSLDFNAVEQVGPP